MGNDRHAARSNNGNHDDRVVRCAVDEVADAQCRNRTFAGGRGNGRIGRSTDGARATTPLPNTVIARDDQIAVGTARGPGRAARRPSLGHLRGTAGTWSRTGPLGWSDGLTDRVL